MLNCFKAGFIKFATEESGMTQREAEFAWKRAAEFPGMEESLFKQLGGSPEAAQAQPQEEQLSPEDLEVLQQLMQNNQNAQEIAQARQQLTF